MKTAPFETDERPVTPHIRLQESPGTEYGKNMLVVARGGVFQSTVMFKYPWKTGSF